MAIKLAYELQNDWPALAWHAELNVGSDMVTLRAGPRVEYRDDWFCEAVWNGPFADGRLDETDLVFGSGGRVRDGYLNFVSSGSTVDRLCFIRQGSRYFVSNSLVNLAAWLNAEFDVAYGRYSDDFSSNKLGIDVCQKIVESTVGEFEFVYFDNLKWDGSTLEVVRKAGRRVDFSDYADYHNYLKTGLAAIVDNLTSGVRAHPMQMVGTLSRGFDSTTVCALMKPLGLENVFTFKDARSGAVDDGTELGKLFGLNVHAFRRDEWRQGDDAREALIILGDGAGADLPFMAAERLMTGAVLFTGYAGEQWRKHPPDLSENLVKTDSAGLSLAEYRLVIGCIHVPVAFFGGRLVRSIAAINRSDEMRPWDIGGAYTKPICRRIVEDAGIPREMFGQKKMAAAHVVGADLDFLSAGNTPSFKAWLASHRGAWLKRGRIPPSWTFDKLVALALRSLQLFAMWLRKNLRAVPVVWRLADNKALFRISRLSDNLDPTGVRQYLFPWAMDMAKRTWYRGDSSNSR